MLVYTAILWLYIYGFSHCTMKSPVDVPATGYHSNSVYKWVNIIPLHDIYLVKIVNVYICIYGNVYMHRIIYHITGDVGKSVCAVCC